MASENTTLNPMEIMLQRRLAALEAQNILMKQLGTRLGFFQAYFTALPNFKTNELAFEHINKQYYDCWGQYRYEDYNSFRRQRDRYLKNRK